MNTFLILVKFTVDVNELKPDPVTREPDLDRAPLRINDFDENAVEEGVRLKEMFGGRVAALSLVVDEPPRDLVLRILAMGVDAFYLVTKTRVEPWDAFGISAALVAAIRNLCTAEGINRPELIICGDTSVDSLNSQTGPRIAESLDLPLITDASHIVLEDGTLSADRNRGDRVEKVQTALPAVVTIGMEANEPRLPTVLQVMGAGSKPIVIQSADDVGESVAIDPPAAIRTRSILAPPEDRKQILVAGDGPGEMARELVKLLGRSGDLVT